MNENYLDFNNPNLKLAGARAAMRKTSLAMFQMYMPDYTQEEYDAEKKRLGL